MPLATHSPEDLSRNSLRTASLVPSQGQSPPPPGLHFPFYKSVDCQPPSPASSITDCAAPPSPAEPTGPRPRVVRHLPGEFILGPDPLLHPTHSLNTSPASLPGSGGPRTSDPPGRGWAQPCCFSRDRRTEAWVPMTASFMWRHREVARCSTWYS